MNKKEIIYDDIIAFHPSSYIEEIVEEWNMTQKEFAKRLDTTEKNLSKLLSGTIPLSKDIAWKLSQLTGISYQTWMNLQSVYDQKALEIIERQKSDKEEAVCADIDFQYFKKHGLIEDTRHNLKQKIEALHKILKVSSLSLLEEFNTAVSYRNTRTFTPKSVINSNILLELASNIARNKTETKLDQKKLEKLLPDIRKMTLQSPEEFYPVLKSKLLECGVVLVCLPNLKNANLNGATKKFKNGSVLLLLTDRNKDSDIFWFSLFHELGHICKGDFYSNVYDEKTYSQKEEEADVFARNWLIPEAEYKLFVRQSQFDQQSVKAFAKRIAIHPSIVVGRLQKEEKIEYTQLATLKTQYTISLNPMVV